MQQWASQKPENRSCCSQTQWRLRSDRSTLPIFNIAKGSPTSSECSILSECFSLNRTSWSAARGSLTQNLIALYKAMGGGWEQGRSRPVLDDVTRETMNQRSDWKGLLEAPLPAPDADALPNSSGTAKP